MLESSENVGNIFKREGVGVLSFHRLVVGKGIEKVVEDYAAEVMKQTGLAYGNAEQAAQPSRHLSAHSALLRCLEATAWMQEEQRLERLSTNSWMQ